MPYLGITHEHPITSATEELFDSLCALTPKALEVLIPSIEEKVGVKVFGFGGNKIVFGEADSSKIEAFYYSYYHEIDIMESDDKREGQMKYWLESKRSELRRNYLCQKIMHELFPDHFPSMYAFSVRPKLEGDTMVSLVASDQREKITKVEHTPEEKQRFESELQKIVTMLNTHGAYIQAEVLNPDNVIKSDTGNWVYIDDVVITPHARMLVSFQKLLLGMNIPLESARAQKILVWVTKIAQSSLSVPELKSFEEENTRFSKSMSLKLSLLKYRLANLFN